MTDQQSPADEPAGAGAPMNTADDQTWVDVLGRVMERWVPDALTTAIGLMVVLVGLSLVLVDSRWDKSRPGAAAEAGALIEANEANSESAASAEADETAAQQPRGAYRRVDVTLAAYYRGLWMFLGFTMQMTLILVLSLIISATPLFKNLVISVSRVPQTRTQVVAMAALCAAAVAYLNWGLSLALGPVIAIHFAREAERKGITVDFLFLLGVLAGAGSIWQFGLSASAPLIMASPTRDLLPDMDVMPLSTTIWSTASLVHVTTFMVATIAAGVWLMPRRARPISQFADSMKVADVVATSGEAVRPGGMTTTPAQLLEHSSLVLMPLALMLAGWLGYHFFVLGESLDINSVNTALLLVGILLHRSVANFQNALREAIGLCWPVVVLYHLYAGVAGLIQFTPVGDFLVTLIDPISTKYTFPFLTASISTVVAIFIPTSGGQWAIQGYVVSTAAETVGVSPQRALLALSVGDHMGNLLTPFWAVVGASIARVDFRAYFGYRLIFAALWFVIGVLCFTFLPC